MSTAPWRGALPAGFRTRFAPSPTGFLHLGHVLNAIWTWGLARAAGGTVLLRLEDHDATRCRPEYESALLEDLDWLGFVPDVGRTDEYRTGGAAWRQRDRGARYEARLKALREAGHAYLCECSRATIAAVAGDVFNEETRYPGTCRARGLAPAPGRGWRVRMEPGGETFTDLVHGAVRQDPDAQCGDVLVRDRNGNWTYQFAVALDDLEQDVDVVIRGDDLLASTGRQLRLARLMGRERMPRFVHHPLIRHPDGAKLSKSAGDTGVRELRAQGRSPAEVIGEAAHRGGLQQTSAPLEAGEVAALFGRW